MPVSIGTTTVTALYLGTTSITSAYLGNTLVFGGSFTPLSLFSGGAQGIWLDPSDLSTMFSDRAGTTPVTTPGTVVGLRLDKSKGLALGAELVTNGTFDANITGWTVGPGSWNAGRLQITQDGSGAGTPSVRQVITTVAGSWYKITFSWDSGTHGNPYFSVATFANGNDILGYTTLGAGTGTRTAHFRATTTTTHINLGVWSGTPSTVAYFDNVTVKELPGNHAVAPTDAARPIYGVEPKGGRRNLLLATDTLATQSLTVTAVAHTLAFTGTGTLTLTGASTAGPLVGTGAGNRVSLTFTPTAASLTLTVSGSVTLGQLELGSSATAYQKVVTAYNVTESGVATCHYVQFDGSDDSMSTAAIDFTATDKMSVFAGVRKLGDVASGASATSIIVELGASGVTHLAGSTGYNTGQKYSFYSKGSAGANAVTTNAAYTAPVSNVLTGLGDISGDRATLRINGSQVAQVTTDQGTGNYGSNVLFIGRRNNAEFPFNGKDYGLIVVGKAASAGEITDTETWLAARTAQVTL